MAGKRTGLSKNRNRAYHWAYCVKKRCVSHKDKDYHLYGGRGIQFQFTTVDELVAKADEMANLVGFRCIEEALDNGYSIDRINNNGHYHPDNVRLATWSEQNRNRRPWKKKVDWSGDRHAT